MDEQMNLQEFISLLVEWSDTKPELRIEPWRKMDYMMHLYQELSEFSKTRMKIAK